MVAPFKVAVVVNVVLLIPMLTCLRLQRLPLSLLLVAQLVRLSVRTRRKLLAGVDITKELVKKTLTILVVKELINQINTTKRE